MNYRMKAKVLKGLLSHIKGLGDKKFDVDKAAKKLDVPQFRLWAYISFALRVGLLKEPGGKGSRVYTIIFNGQTVAQALKNEEERLGMPTKTTKAKTSRRKARPGAPIYHQHSEGSDSHLRAKIHAQADLIKEADEKQLDIDVLDKMHGGPAPKKPSKSNRSKKQAAAK